jgi:hypothetical protein
VGHHVPLTFQCASAPAYVPYVVLIIYNYCLNTNTNQHIKYYTLIVIFTKNLHIHEKVKINHMAVNGYQVKLDSSGCSKLRLEGFLEKQLSYIHIYMPTSMDHNLRDASEQGDIDALYKLIAIDAKVLDKIDEIPFVETPLHIAAAAGQTQFAMEMIMLKPSFDRKLNPNGFTPLLVAMHNNQTLLVRELLAVHKDLHYKKQCI